MRYISTRGEVQPKTFSEILLEGLAPDGGLYVPETYPQLDMEHLKGSSYQDIAQAVLTAYMPEVPQSEIREIVNRTYTQEVFGSQEIVPLQKLEPGLSLMKLSNGPTLAFKDIALQLLGNLMETTIAKRKGERLTILGATSGDTGAAAEYAIRGRKNLSVFMLSPKGRMSRFQQRQMYTLQDTNVYNIVVDGTFDDCQAIVKQVNADSEFKSRYSIGAVNSINWARIIAQSVYYITSYLSVTDAPGDKVSFAVPSGNFGNALAAYVAKRMGVGVENIIVSTNENDVLDEFFRTGVYRVRKGKEVRVTSSPSMDIASASNFERLVFDLAERDAVRVRALWAEVGATSKFSAPDLREKSAEFIASGSATDAEVLATMRDVYAKYGVVVDPHTAVGLKVGLEHRGSAHLVVAETAQPVKFAETIHDAIGFEPSIPPQYVQLAEMPERYISIQADAERVKEIIRSNL